MNETEICSFCGKPRASVLHLFVGPGGCNICDSCISQKPIDASAVTETSKCGFCGRKSGEVPILLASGKAAICRYCFANCQDYQSEMLDVKSEFLSTQMPAEASEAVKELKELVRAFAGHFDWFTEAFSAGEIDWAAHNDMAQLLHPIRSKAGRISDEQLSDVVWRIDQMFMDIHFDDVEANAPHVKQLDELINQLLAIMKKIAE